MISILVSHRTGINGSYPLCTTETGDRHRPYKSPWLFILNSTMIFVPISYIHCKIGQTKSVNSICYLEYLKCKLSVIRHRCLWTGPCTKSPFQFYLISFSFFFYLLSLTTPYICLKWKNYRNITTLWHFYKRNDNKFLKNNENMIRG